MDGINYVEIGRRIREVRKAQKLTQEEASEKCDITSSFYGNIERGNKKMSVETLAKISIGLGVSTDRLLFGEVPEEEKDIAELLSALQRKADKGQYLKYLSIMKAISSVIDTL